MLCGLEGCSLGHVMYMFMYILSIIVMAIVLSVSSDNYTPVHRCYVRVHVCEMCVK